MTIDNVLDKYSEYSSVGFCYALPLCVNKRDVL